VARRFRLYEKKRGHRRTGSKKVGSFGEALFFSLFLAVGVAACTGMLVMLVIPEWRANRHFVETTCTVLSKQVIARHGSDGDTYRPDIEFEYQVDRQVFRRQTYDITEMFTGGRERSEAAVAQFEVGKQYPCWYNPANPGEAVIVRGYSGWLYLLLLIPTSFIVIGIGGLVYTILHWGTSAERRAVIAQQRAQKDLFEAADPTDRTFPTIPDDENLTNSPGIRLAYRLPIAMAPGWALFAAAIACLIWNGIVTVFVVMALNRHLEGRPDWFLTIFVVPFVAIGIALVAYLIRQLLITTGVGATRVEVSDHPLNPGYEFGVFLSQAGRLTMNSLELVLACDEKATYKQGTDTRTERLRVFEQQVFKRDAFEIEQSAPFETECLVRVPVSGMHSFKTDHNEISWSLVVRGEVEGWPDFERVFPVIVYPGDSGLQDT